MVKRYLGIDYGDKRIGLALSDPLGMSALPYETIENNAKKLSIIQDLIKERDVAEIIVGNPINLKGVDTLSTVKAREFKEQIEQNVNIPVRLWDERLTTKSAGLILREAGLSHQKRKTLIDTVAAVIMLQSYMDYRKKNPEII